MTPSPAPEKGVKPLPVWKSFGASATAACTAELLTIPLDTAKARLSSCTSYSRLQVLLKYTTLVGRGIVSVANKVECEA